MFDALAEPPGGMPLDAADLELVDAATAVLLRHYRPFWHTVAAALRGRDGRVWTGVHIGATVGRLSVCAEAVAFGRAVMEGDGTVGTAVAVRHPKPDETGGRIAVVPPCGACREMITDYSADAMVIVPTGGPGSGSVADGATPLAAPQNLIKVPVRLLLPFPYQR